MNRRRNNSDQEDNNDRGVELGGVLATVGIGAAVGGLAYFIGRKFFGSAEETGPSTSRQQPQPDHDIRDVDYDDSTFNTTGLRRSLPSISPNPTGVSGHSVPVRGINNLNALLDDIYVKFIALKDEDFELYYKVFCEVFSQYHETMKEVDVYFKRYSSIVQFNGSHYDNLKIDKPNEFDVIIAIDLPVSRRVNQNNPADSDIVFEPKNPAYIQLKMGKQFQLLPKQHNFDINKTAYMWMDKSNYLLQSKFTDWFKSVTWKARNRLSRIQVNGRWYNIGVRVTGPAITLNITDGKGFDCDVDLVPAFRFHKDRWPICRGYRDIPKKCTKEWWFTIPKINRKAQEPTPHDNNRSWRVVLPLQERDIMHGYNHLKQTIRFIKKLRDVLQMDQIASYYIKMLFYWEIDDCEDNSIWNNKPSTLFITMVKRLHDALRSESLPYFWHKRYNLFGQIENAQRIGYANKLSKLLEILGDPSQYMLVATYLLTQEELSIWRSI